MTRDEFIFESKIFDYELRFENFLGTFLCVYFLLGILYVDLYLLIFRSNSWFGFIPLFIGPRRSVEWIRHTGIGERYVQGPDLSSPFIMALSLFLFVLSSFIINKLHLTL